MTVEFITLDGRIVPIRQKKLPTAKIRIVEPVPPKGFKSSKSHYQTEKAFTVPNATCPKCGANVYYYEHPNGAKVFFDALGPPWPKHPCTSAEPSPQSPPNKTKPSFDSSGWQPLFIKNLTPIDAMGDYQIRAKLNNNTTDVFVINIKPELMRQKKFKRKNADSLLLFGRRTGDGKAEISVSNGSFCWTMLGRIEQEATMPPDAANKKRPTKTKQELESKIQTNSEKTLNTKSRLKEKTRCTGCGTMVNSLHKHLKKCPSRVDIEISKALSRPTYQSSAAELNCPDCNLHFDSTAERSLHRKRCPQRALRSGPSFKAELTKNLLGVRRKIKGTYEWAITESNKSTPKKLKQALHDKSLIELKSEVLRLEKTLVFPASKPSSNIDISLKRQIAYSHALRCALEKAK